MLVTVFVVAGVVIVLTAFGFCLYMWCRSYKRFKTSLGVLLDLGRQESERLFKKTDEEARCLNKRH